MKFVRHFLAVLVAVGVVVALGFVWSESGAASLVADGRRGRLRDTARPRTPAFGVNDLGRKGGGFSLSNIGDLLQTLVVLALITMAVVIIDRSRRRFGRSRRFPAPAGRDRT